MNTPSYGNEATLAMLHSLTHEPTIAKADTSKIKKPKDVSARQWKKLRKAVKRGTPLNLNF